MGYYDEISEGYNELHSGEQLKKLGVIFDKFDIRKDKVLDVGCGTAFYFGFFEDYTGVDNSLGMIEKSDANVIFGEAEKLLFKDDSFDTVISLSAIHNFDDPKKAVDEMKRVSRGKIIITVFKRAKNFKEIENLLKDFDRTEEDKDVIFYSVS
jgi:ubiquinone/menaquinone biosynthesis C-methylase UbiE